MACGVKHTRIAASTRPEIVAPLILECGVHCGGVRLTRAELFQADLEVAKALELTHRARGILAFEDGVIERSVDEAREAVRVQRGVADVAASEGNQPPGRARATSRTPLRGRDLTR